MITDKNFRKYYQTDRYRGFHKVNERFDNTSRTTLLVFSNGKKQIYTSGIYTEGAMFKAFNAIDQYYAQKRLRGNLLAEAS
ncbi:MAG: hypothetical protein U5K69_12410 [Balneolaceae bacterium]|nr:hypothetical protein [Balneolaceae bacterium]